MLTNSVIVIAAKSTINSDTTTGALIVAGLRTSTAKTQTSTALLVRKTRHASEGREDRTHTSWVYPPGCA